MEELIPVIRQELAQGRGVCFSPKGTSMLPMLRQGVDSVVLAPLPEKLKKYDLPLYQRRNGQYVLHRIVKTGDTFTCMGDNQFEEEPGICEDQFIAVVIAFYRGRKLYSVRQPGYRIYCRFWYHSRHIRRFWRRGTGWLRRILK